MKLLVKKQYREWTIRNDNHLHFLVDSENRPFVVGLLATEVILHLHKFIVAELIKYRVVFMVHVVGLGAYQGLHTGLVSNLSLGTKCKHSVPIVIERNLETMDHRE